LRFAAPYDRPRLPAHVASQTGFRRARAACGRGNGGPPAEAGASHDEFAHGLKPGRCPAIQTKCRTLSRSAVTLLTNCLAPPESDRNALRNCYGDTGCLMGSLKQVSLKPSRAAPTLSVDCDDGCESALALAPRSAAVMGLGLCARLGLNQLADRLDGMA
jgi:hypothetical protein